MVCALFGFSVLPLSWAGPDRSCCSASTLLVVDAHVTSHGALTLSGLVAIAVGLITLFHKAPAPYHTSIPLVVTVTALLGGFWAFAMAKAVAVRRSPVRVGPAGDRRHGGRRADRRLRLRPRRALAGAEPTDAIAPGEHVQVDALDGLTLDVHRIES